MAVIVTSFNEDELLSIDDHVLTDHERIVIYFCQKAYRYKRSFTPIHGCEKQRQAIKKLIALEVIVEATTDPDRVQSYELTPVARRLPRFPLPEGVSDITPRSRKTTSSYCEPTVSGLP